MAPKKRLSAKRAWLGRILFIALAGFIWMLLQVAERKFNYQIAVPVELTDVPADLLIITRPDSVLLEVNAAGLYGWRQSWREQDVKRLSFEDFQPTTGGRFFISSRRMLAEWSLPSEGAVAWSALEDTLWVKTSVLERVKLPVESKIKVTYSPPYFGYGKRSIRPDSLFVFGPAEVLDTLRSIPTEVVVKTDVRQSFSTVVALRLPPSTHSSTREVTVSQEVRVFTEKWVEVPLQISGNRGAWKPEPGFVRVKCRVALEDYQRLNGDVFVATYKRNIEGDAESPIEWTHVPGYVELLDWQPKYVEIIER